MLKDMGHAGRINRHGFKSNTEGIFRIFIADMDMARTCF